MGAAARAGDERRRGRPARSLRPTTLDSLDSSYAYWALGHIHQRQEVRGDPPVRYAGNVQGRQFGEEGAKGALVVTLDRGAAPEIDFEALAPVRWETLEPEGLDAAHNVADVKAAVAAAFSGPRSEAPPDQEWILRVDLRGACPLAQLLSDGDERTELAAQLREDLDVLDVEVRDRGLHRPLDLDSHRDQPHLLGQTRRCWRARPATTLRWTASRRASWLGVTRAMPKRVASISASCWMAWTPRPPSGCCVTRARHEA